MHDLRQFSTRVLALFCLLALTGCWHTRSASERPVRIALISDTHTTRGTNEDQAWYRGRLDRAIAAINQANVDLVLIAGDLTQDGKPHELQDFQRQLQGFEAPVWYVPGNHDVGGKRIPGKKGEFINPKRLATYEAALGPSWFAREIPGVRVIGINASLLGSGVPRENEQWEFLERELAQPARKPRIALLHYPPFLQEQNEPGGDYWNLEPEPRQRLLKLLSQGGVRAVLSGHIHRRIVTWNGGTLYLTSAPISFALPRGKERRMWTLLTVPRQGKVQYRSYRLWD